MSKKSKMRRLARTSGQYTKQRSCKWNIILVTCTTILVLPIISAISFLRFDLKPEAYLSSLKFQIKEKSNLAYNYLRYGEFDNCSVRLDSREIFKFIRQRVVGQHRALNVLEELVHNFTTGTDKSVSIGLVGSSGVGKSLTASTIFKTFKWRRNSHYLDWDHLSMNGNSFLSELKFKLSRCHPNLLIIDNFNMKNVGTIVKLNREILELRKYQILTIFIVNLPSYTDRDLIYIHLNRYKIFADLNPIPIVNFKVMSDKDIDDCIVLEQKLLKLNLDDKLVDQFRLDKNGRIRFGCKRINSKMLLYLKH